YCRLDIAPVAGAGGAPREMLPPPPPHGGSSRVERPQPHAGAGRPLQGVARGLVPPPEGPPPPPGATCAALPAVGTRGLGQRVVRRVADQEVSEAVRLVVSEHGLVRADEVLPDEGHQPALDLWFVGGERRNSAAVEHQPFDCTALQDAALGGVEL